MIIVLSHTFYGFFPSYKTLYHIEISFNTFANRTDPDQVLLCFAYGNMICLILN